MPFAKLSCIQCGLKLSLFVLTLFSPAASFGHADVPSLVPIPIEVAFIPQDYNNSESIEIVVTGTFPSTCYKVGPHNTTVDAKNRLLKISQMAYQYHSPNCSDLYPVKFYSVIEVGILPTARDVVYTVRDGNFESSLLGRLPVKKAFSVAPADKPLVAHVLDAYVDGRNKVAVVTVILPNSCLSVSDVWIFRSGKNVVVVRPILVLVDKTNCIDGNFLYKKTVPMPSLEIGAYLLQARNVNGRYFENIFQWYPPN